MPTAFQVIQRMREEVLRDVAAPQLFSDDEIFRALVAGYRTFARHTHWFIDDFALQTISGQAKYSLDPKICYVRQVSLDGRYLTPYTRRAKPRAYSGRPSAYSTDAAQSILKVWPVPDDVYDLTLDCAFIPTVVTQGDQIDLTDEWLECIMNYAAARVLNNNDPDGSQQIAAALFERRWKEQILLAKKVGIVQQTGEALSVQPREWI